jgi:hypothetical protein
MSIGELWTTFVSPLMYFLTLATARPTGVKSQTVSVRNLKAEVLAGQWAAASHPPADRFWEHLLPPAAIQGSFELTMRSWFGLFPGSASSDY